MCQKLPVQWTLWDRFDSTHFTPGLFLVPVGSFYSTAMPSSLQFVVLSLEIGLKKNLLVTPAIGSGCPDLCERSWQTKPTYECQQNLRTRISVPRARTDGRSGAPQHGNRFARAKKKKHVWKRCDEAVDFVCGRSVAWGFQWLNAWDFADCTTNCIFSLLRCSWRFLLRQQQTATETCVQHFQLCSRNVSQNKALWCELQIWQLSPNENEQVGEHKELLLVISEAWPQAKRRCPLFLFAATSKSKNRFTEKLWWQNHALKKLFVPNHALSRLETLLNSLFHLGFADRTHSGIFVPKAVVQTLVMQRVAWW